MRRTATVVSLVAATWALSACGVNSPDTVGAGAPHDAPQLFVDLQSLPDGHPPIPGASPLPTLPESHPPIPGYDSSPALPEGHPRCPASDALETPPSDANVDRGLQDLPDLIST
jgi:hypothetical protein